MDVATVREQQAMLGNSLNKRGVEIMTVNEMLETLSDAINILDANNETAIADNMMEIIAYIKSINGMEEE